MMISEQGLQLIRKWEGCRLAAYVDAVGIATIGYGCIVYPDGRDVSIGDRITQEQAEALLLQECQRKAKAVDGMITVSVNQNQFDALVSLAFNIGEGALRASTLLRKLNAGDHAGAADQFLVWNKGTINGVKVEIEGLRRRRVDEKASFESDAVAAEPISLEPSPQERATWLEAYGDQGKTLIVAWRSDQLIEILELQSASKKVLMEVIDQYPNASNLVIAAPGKALPSGERVKVSERRSAGGAAGGASPGEAPAVPAEILARGSTGAEVSSLQARLQELGFNTGPLDGEFGLGTDRAVRAFQAEVFGPAQADGLVGPRTWGALWANAPASADDDPPAPAGTPGKTYLRLTQSGTRDRFGLIVLHLDYIKSGIPSGRLKVCSGAPGRQAFRRGAESQARSFEPLPEGVWTIHDIAWCDGKDQYDGRIFESGLGPVSTPISYKAPGTTQRSAIEIHLDWNKNHGAPGTAGCIGINTIGDYKTLVSWLRESDPRELYVDWGLGSCPSP
jgi:lysozyme